MVNRRNPPQSLYSHLLSMELLKHIIKPCLCDCWCIVEQHTGCLDHISLFSSVFLSHCYTRLTAYCDVDCIAAALSVLTPVQPTVPTSSGKRTCVRLVFTNSAPKWWTTVTVEDSLPHSTARKELPQHPAWGVSLRHGALDGELLPSEELSAAGS